MRALLVALALLLAGCSGDSGKDDGADPPEGTDDGDDGDGEGPGMGEPAQQEGLWVPAETSWTSQLTETKAGTTQHQSAEQGASCYLLTFAGLALSGNVTATWTAQSPGSEQLSLVVATETGDVLESTSGDSPLTLSFALETPLSTLNVYPTVQSPGAALDLEIDMDGAFEATLADVTAAEDGVCN